MEHTILFLLGAVACVVVLFLLALLIQTPPSQLQPPLTKLDVNATPRTFTPCWTEEIFVVRGYSMAPILRDGERVILLHGYYRCNRVRRGDLVAIEIKTLLHPIVKRVVAIPGDVVEEKEGKIVVNGVSTGAEMTQILRIPLKRYGWRIPSGAVLVLSNDLSADMDSRRLGLISMNQILGKVIKGVNQ